MVLTSVLGTAPEEEVEGTPRGVFLYQTEGPLIVLLRGTFLNFNFTSSVQVCAAATEMCFYLSMST
jgi:hypothetical protein